MARLTTDHCYLVRKGNVIRLRLPLILRSSFQLLSLASTSHNLYRRDAWRYRGEHHEGHNYDVARQVARLWPHRKHESPAQPRFFALSEFITGAHSMFVTYIRAEQSTIASGVPGCVLTESFTTFDYG